MATRLTRRKIALHVAEKLLAGVPTATVLKSAAAYLVEARRTREIELLVRDIEDVLAEKGVVVADITTAFPLTDALRSDVRTMLGGKPQLREMVDPLVLGGIRIDLPGKQYDATIQRKLTALRAKQL